MNSKRKNKRIRQEKNRRRKEAIEKVLNNKDLVELIDSFNLRNFIMYMSATLWGGAFRDGGINGTLYLKNEKEPIYLLNSIEDYISLCGFRYNIYESSLEKKLLPYSSNKDIEYDYISLLERDIMKMLNINKVIKFDKKLNNVVHAMYEGYYSNPEESIQKIKYLIGKKLEMLGFKVKKNDGISRWIIAKSFGLKDSYKKYNDYS